MSVFDYVRPEKTTMKGDAMSRNIMSRKTSIGHLVMIITLCAVLGACSAGSACNPAGNPLPGTVGQVMDLKGVDAFFDALIKHADTREPDL